jgi:thymidylate synthase
MAGERPDGAIAVYLQAPSLDDLLNQALSLLLSSGEIVSPTKGESVELQAAMLELTNPRARLSRSETRGRLFSCLGELCWYLSGSEDIDAISYYLPAYAAYSGGGYAHAAYGPRLFNYDGFDQVQYVIGKLVSNPSSRRAVVQLFDHSDIQTGSADVPCTCTLQFLVRAGSLHLITHMRSNDIHLGLPHDLFAFTMLQELVASALGLPLGSYVHVAGSLHLYCKDRPKAEAYLAEGWHSNIEMPAMPRGDPWPSVRKLLAVEASLRAGSDPLSADLDAHAYWRDLTQLLAIFALIKRDRRAEIPSVKARLSDHRYDVFIEDRAGGAP